MPISDDERPGEEAMGISKKCVKSEKPHSGLPFRLAHAPAKGAGLMGQSHFRPPRNCIKSASHRLFCGDCD